MFTDRLAMIFTGIGLVLLVPILITMLGDWLFKHPWADWAIMGLLVGGFALLVVGLAFTS